MTAFVNVPGLSGLKDAAHAFKESVNPFDVLVGVGVGLVAGAVGKQLFDAKIAKTVNAAGAVSGFVDASQGVGRYASQYAAQLAGALAGLGLFAAQKGNKRGAGHLVGAVGGAVLPLVANEVTKRVLPMLPGGLHGYVMNPYGMIANDPSYGMIANDPSYGMIANDPAYGTAYVNLPGSMGELRALSHAIGEDADEYTV